MRFPIVYSLCLYNATGNAAGIKNPITEIPEQAESQSTALEPGNSESREQAEVQDSQSENPAQAAFTGGITLYADSRTAYVNSEPVEMPAAPFVENGNFYIPLQFVAKTMGWSYQEQSGTVALASSSPPDHAHGRNTDDPRRR